MTKTKSEYSNDWYHKNKQHVKKYRLKWKASKSNLWHKKRQKQQNHYRVTHYHPRNKHLVLLNYSPKGSRKPKCNCCGETMIECLSIDHKKPRKGKHKKRNFGSINLYSWLKSHNFPKGYQTYCINCNFAKGKLGKCPHKI